mmetsp:Transcript_6580/g.10854  ORF Transcript_6580/g.10854 Transcript_6580/m.10854 type:complete len:310 (-) Transcript_6580:91-1020(-)
MGRKVGRKKGSKPSGENQGSKPPQNVSEVEESDEGDFLAFSSKAKDDNVSEEEGEDDGSDSNDDGRSLGKEPKLTKGQKTELKKIAESAMRKMKAIKEGKNVGSTSSIGSEDDDGADSKGKDGGKRGKKRRSRRRPKGRKANRGVVYLGHIPHGFYENEMQGFFSQFGEVTRLRLSRNRKTKRSKGYAFIEFKLPEVADIVAQTFNGYMMFGRTLVAKRIPTEKVNKNTFLGWDQPLQKLTKPVDTLSVEKAKRKRPRTRAQHAKRMAALVGKEKKFRKRLAEEGIDYDFNGYEQQFKAQTSTKTVFKD